MEMLRAMESVILPILSLTQSTRKPYTFELFSNVAEILLQDPVPSFSFPKNPNPVKSSTGTEKAFLALTFYP